MPWNTLATTDITPEILPDEVTLLNTIQGSSTILAAKLPQWINELQSQINAGGNIIGPSGTVPDQIRSDCIAWVIWKWFKSVPKTDLLSDARKDAYKDANDRLKEIRTGREKTEIPVAPVALAATGSNPIQAIRPGKRMQNFGSFGET